MSEARISRWDRFWFETAPTQRLAYLRIAFAALLLLKFWGYHGLTRLDRPLRIPGFSFQGQSDYLIGFLRAPWPGLEWLPAPDLFGFLLLELGIQALALLFLLGLGTRLVGPLLAVALAFLVWIPNGMTYPVGLVLFMNDLGWEQLEYSNLTGTWGIGAALLGSVAGGFIADRIGARRLAAIAATLYAALYAFGALAIGAFWLHGRELGT